jgi:hypothetical protein
MKDVTESSPDHGERIDTGVRVEMPVLLGNDGFLQQRRDLIQLSFHPPLLVFSQEGVYNFPFIIRDDGGVFNFTRQGKYPVEDKKKQDQPKDADTQPFEETEDPLFGDPEF